GDRHHSRASCSFRASSARITFPFEQEQTSRPARCHPAAPSHRGVRAWLFLASPQRLSLCLHPEIESPVLGKEVRGERGTRPSNDQEAAFARMEGGDCLGV